MKPLLVDVSDSRSMRHNNRHLVSSGGIDDVANTLHFHFPHFILLL